MRKWFVSILFILIVMSACSPNPVQPVPDNPLAEDFVTIWEAFDESYPEFPIKSIDWTDWQMAYYTYYPMAQAAETSDEVMMNAVLPMLADLQDLHVWMKPPGGDQFFTYPPDFWANYDMTVLVQNYLEPNSWTGWSNSVGYCNPDSLPYLGIKSWPSDLNLSQIDDFVALCSDIPAIIIDVRMNGGGSDLRVNGVVGRFTHTECVGCLLRIRTGPGYDNCEYEELLNRVLGPQQYDGTIYLLIGENCASTNEEFIVCMNELPNVVLLGDTTIGAVCIPEWMTLDSGWSLTHGVMSIRTAREEPVEWFGIAPDIYVEATEDDFAQGIDPVLEYAIGMLGDRE